MTDLSIPRTLVVTNDFPPRIGGVQQYVRNLVGAFPPDSVTVLAPRWEGWREHDASVPFRVVRYPAKVVVPVREARERVLSLARETGAEVVLLGSGFATSGFGAGLSQAGFPHVVLTHGVEYWLARVPGAAQVMGRSVSRASHVTALSDYILKQIRPMVPKHVPLSLCPPGVDVKRFDPGVSGQDVRRKHGLSDRPLIVCVSRLVPRKGQDVLIRSMAEIRERSPDASLLIVGDGSYRAKLEKMSREAPAGSVVFAGAVSDEALPEYHAAADVFAMPCRSRWGGLEVEGFGIVFMEASASGRAVVAGDSGGAAEAVLDGVTGMVIDGRDQHATAQAIGACLADPEMAAALGKAGRARAEEHYAWPEITSMVAGYLREAVR